MVLDDAEASGDLVRDMIEVLTWFCARRYCRRPARDRALKAIGCAQRGIGPQGAAAEAAAARGGR